MQTNCNSLIWLVLLFSCFAIAMGIMNVPYHRQITRYACGDASFEMIYHYYRQDIDQRAVIDVCRTSFHLGTNTFDLIRAAHFSNMSSAQSNKYYPEQAPESGWKPSIPHGMAGFGYYGNECWIEQLKSVIGKGYPILVLNHFSESDLGGHFRVAVDYDENSITLLDPWDRFWPRIVTFSNEEFCEMWNIPEYYESSPYWAGFISPFEVDISFIAQNYSTPGPENNYLNYIRIHADIHYPCPEPFCNKDNDSVNDFTAKNTFIYLSLPNNMRDLNNNTIIEIGDFHPTNTISKEWDIEIDDSLDKFDEILSNKIRVEVIGEIEGSVAEAFCCYEDEKPVYYPAYTYTDTINGFNEIHY